MPSSYIFLLLAILAETIATSALQASQQFTRIGPSIIVFAGYAISFYFLALTLRSVPVGVAYAIWSGLGVVLISIIGLVIYNQKLDMAAIVGIGMIIGGVAIMHLFSNSAGH